MRVSIARGETGFRIEGMLKKCYRILGSFTLAPAPAPAEKFRAARIKCTHACLAQALSHCLQQLSFSENGLITSATPSAKRMRIAVLICAAAANAFSTTGRVPQLVRGSGGSATRLFAERWFVKTEQFSAPFPTVKPHLEAHRAWVKQLRRDGVTVTSGYRVDSDGKPGGGGMLFLQATSFDEAKKIVLSDPLIANGCVDWRLNEWISEVGGIQVV